MRSFFNTLGITGGRLKDADQKAESQEQKILKHFMFHIHSKFTPEQIKVKLYPSEATPLTSIRRALTNLTNKGRLIKLDDFAPSSYGSKQHYWKLKTA